MKIYVNDNDKSMITFKDGDGVIQIIRGKRVTKRTMPHVRLGDNRVLEPEEQKNM